MSLCLPTLLSEEFLCSSGRQFSRQDSSKKAKTTGNCDLEHCTEWIGWILELGRKVFQARVRKEQFPEPRVCLTLCLDGVRVTSRLRALKLHEWFQIFPFN